MRATLRLTSVVKCAGHTQEVTLSVGTLSFPTVVPHHPGPQTMFVEPSPIQAKKTTCLRPALTTALLRASFGCVVKFINFPGPKLFAACSLTEQKNYVAGSG